MKTTTKWIATAAAALAIFFTANVNAQTTTTTTKTDDSPWRLGIGLETGLPTGRVHDFSNFELGGTARLQYDVNKSFAVTLTSGYYNFFGKDIAGTNVYGGSLGVIPVKLGIKAFFAPQLYFGAEGGAGFVTHGGTNTKLILSPAVGWANKSWDVGVRYESLSGQSYNYGIAGLRIAYAFGL